MPSRSQISSADGPSTKTQKAIEASILVIALHTVTIAIFLKHLRVEIVIFTTYLLTYLHGKQHIRKRSVDSVIRLLDSLKIMGQCSKKHKTTE